MYSAGCAAVFLFGVLTSPRLLQAVGCDHGTCEDASRENGAKGSAMMQINSKHTVAPAQDLSGAPASMAFLDAPAPASMINLEESRNCVSIDLQEMHFQAIRRYARMLAEAKASSKVHKRSSQPSLEDEETSLEDLTPAPATKAPSNEEPSLEDLTSAPVTKAPEQPSLEDLTPAPTTKAPKQPSLEDLTPAPATKAPTKAPEKPSLEDLTPAPVTPAPKPPATQAPAPVASGNESLDAAGFKQVTSLCCPEKTEVFFIRLLNSMGQDVCSKPHVQGLMHWFTCVPDMDFQYMVDVINDGNPCKYWGPTGATCPALSAQCAGHWCR